jgi:DNA-binding NarL/FixJ family response regulator
MITDSKFKASIQDFTRDQVCLIIEPSQTFSASIQNCLNDMDLSLSQVITARKYEDAKRIIQERKPKIIISEYEVEAKFGLSLLEMQGEYFDELSRVSIIITRNTMDSAVAEAAEEDIDAYILKPFSQDSFRYRLLDVLEKKVSPSEYAKKIRLGKRLFESNLLDEALAELLAGKKLNKKPTLACYYIGRIYEAQGDSQKALKEYREGRDYQPLHYKCLTAEFDELMLKENYKEAYPLIPFIKENYPTTAHRLGQFFIAAVFTQNFDDVGSFFQLFLQTELRTPKLIQLTSLALFTAGRSFLAKAEIARACEYFEMGILSTSRDIGYLEKVIDELLMAKAFKEAEGFLGKVLPAEVGSPHQSRLSFKVDRYLLTQEQVIEKGRKLVAAGHGTPEVYEILVKVLAAAGKEPMAEFMISRALETFPQMRSPLYKILTENLPKV